MILDEMTIRRLIAAATAVVASADNTGCSEELTVVAADAVDLLRDALLEIDE